MKISAFTNFVCPVEGLSLLRSANSLHCVKGHNFDVAREGYCNLLLVQQKKTLNPGDNKEMVAARGRFLGGGHFTRIADKLFEIVGTIVAESKGSGHLRIVDAGCGEGYYLDQLRKRAVDSNFSATLELAGFDISKWALKAAAKRSTDIAWAVAGNRQLPFAAGSINLILSMFGFADWESFKTVLAKNGQVLLVDPGPDHLIELRKIIYPTVNVSPLPPASKAIASGFILQREESLKFSISLKNSSQIQDLLAMTPHAFRITAKARKELEALKHLTVTVDVVFRILRVDN